MTVPVISLQPAEALQCVDNEPLNDGFGWNGVCTCSTETYQSHSKFGWSFAASDESLVVGAALSPLGCFNSGSITVYDINTDGSLQWQDELVSSLQASGDRFGEHYTSGELMDINGDYIAVSTHTVPMKITVFQRSVNGWSEKYAFTIADDIIAGYNTRLVKILGDDLFIGAGYLHRYDLASGALLQKFDGPFNETCQTRPGFASKGNYKIGENFISLENHSCIEDKIVYGVFERNGAGYYVQTLTHEAIELFSWIALGDDFATVVEAAFVESVNGGQRLNTGTSTTYVKDIAGAWRSYEFDGNWSPRWLPHEYMLGLDNQVVTVENQQQPGDVTTPIFFQSFNSQNGWSSQELSYEQPIDKFRSVDTSFNQDRFVVVNSDPLHASYHRNIEKLQPDTFEPTLSVFERNSAGQWSPLLQKKYTGGGSVPLPIVETNGNNTFVSLSNGGFLNIIFKDSSCDYSNAEAYDGWGWNPVTGESCPPLDSTEEPGDNDMAVTNADGCDYSEAAVYNGWGWNAELGQSCAPLTETEVADNCDYSNASVSNGWGWNRVTLSSCPPLSDSVDSDTHSGNSELSNNVKCVDSDGDGWGWDGANSCRI